MTNSYGRVEIPMGRRCFLSNPFNNKNKTKQADGTVLSY